MLRSAAQSPAAVAVSRQVVHRPRILAPITCTLAPLLCTCLFVVYYMCGNSDRSAQHATDHRVLQKLGLTHVINASNKIGNPHIGEGDFFFLLLTMHADRVSGVEYLTVPVEDSHEATEEFSQVRLGGIGGAAHARGARALPRPLQHFHVIRDFLLRVKEAGGKVLVGYEMLPCHSPHVTRVASGALYGGRQPERQHSCVCCNVLSSRELVARTRCI